MIKKLIAIVALIAMVAVPAKADDDLLGKLGGMLGSLTSTSKFSVDDLVGQWSYQSPAISFKSDQALNKIGGAAASAAVEEKMAPYYQRIGLNNMTLNVEKVDTTYNFTMKMSRVNLSGTITKNGDDGLLTFHFKAMGKINLGKVSAKAEKSMNNVLSLTFDVSRFVKIIDAVASRTNLSSAKTLSSLLNSYDGIYAGAKLKKTGSAATTDPKQSTTTAPAQNNNSSATQSQLGEALKGLLKKK